MADVTYTLDGDASNLLGAIADSGSGFRDLSTLVQSSVKGALPTLQQFTAAAQQLADKNTFDAADRLAAAVERIGGAAKLTEPDLVRVNQAVDAAIERYAALGTTAPPAIVAVHKEIGALATGTEGSATTIRSAFDSLLGAIDAVGTSVSAIGKQGGLDTITAGIANAAAEIEKMGGVDALATSQQTALRVGIDQLVDRYEALGIAAPKSLTDLQTALTQTGTASADLTTGLTDAQTAATATIGVTDQLVTSLGEAATAATAASTGIGDAGATVDTTAASSVTLDQALRAIDGEQAAAQLTAVADAAKDTTTETTQAAFSIKGLFAAAAGGAAGGALAVQSFNSIVAGAKEILTAVPHMVTTFADLGSHLRDLSLRTDVSVESLSLLRFVGSQTGTDLDLLARVISELGKKLASTGTEAANTRAVLTSIGLSFDDLKTMKPEDAFVTILAALNGLDAGLRNQKGLELFGMRFRSMSNLAREDVRGLMDEAKAASMQISGPDAEAANKFNEALDKLGKMAESARNRFGASLLPMLTAVAEKAPIAGGTILAIGEAAVSSAGGLIGLAASVATVASGWPHMAAGAGAVAGYLRTAATAGGMLGTVLSGVGAVGSTVGPILLSVGSAIGTLAVGGVVIASLGGIAFGLTKVWSAVTGLWTAVKDGKVVSFLTAKQDDTWARQLLGLSKGIDAVTASSLALKTAKPYDDYHALTEAVNLSAAAVAKLTETQKANLVQASRGGVLSPKDIAAQTGLDPDTIAENNRQKSVSDAHNAAEAKLAADRAARGKSGSLAALASNEATRKADLAALETTVAQDDEREQRRTAITKQAASDRATILINAGKAAKDASLQLASDETIGRINLDQVGIKAQLAVIAERERAEIESAKRVEDGTSGAKVHAAQIHALIETNQLLHDEQLRSDAEEVTLQSATAATTIRITKDGFDQQMALIDQGVADRIAATQKTGASDAELAKESVRIVADGENQKRELVNTIAKKERDDLLAVYQSRVESEIQLTTFGMDQELKLEETHYAELLRLAALNGQPTEALEQAHQDRLVAIRRAGDDVTLKGMANQAAAARTLSDRMDADATVSEAARLTQRLKAIDLEQAASGEAGSATVESLASQASAARAIYTTMLTDQKVSDADRLAQLLKTIGLEQAAKGEAGAATLEQLTAEATAARTIYDTMLADETVSDADRLAQRLKAIALEQAAKGEAGSTTIEQLTIEAAAARATYAIMLADQTVSDADRLAQLEKAIGLEQAAKGEAGASTIELLTAEAAAARATYDTMLADQTVSDADRLAQLLKAIGLEQEARGRGNTQTIEGLRKIYAAAKALNDKTSADVSVPLATRQANQKAENDARIALATTTKKAATVRVQIETEALAAMQAQKWKFTADDLVQQKILVYNAQTAAGAVRGVWADAFDSMAQGLAALGSMSGSTMGQIVTSVGQIAGAAQGVSKQLQTMAANGRPNGVISDFTGGNTTQKVGAVVGGAGAIASGIGNIASATDQAGEGKRIAGGAIAGMQAGMVFGPWGAVAGAAIGALVGALRKPDFEKAMNDVGTRYGVKISEGLGRQISKDAKEKFSGSHMAAELFNLGSIVDEAGGITSKNIDTFTANLRDSFALVGQGKLTAQQTADILNTNFSKFSAYIVSSNKVASAGFQEIIALNAKASVQSTEVIAFVSSQTGKAAAGIASLIAPIAKAGTELAALKKTRDDLATTRLDDLRTGKASDLTKDQSTDAGTLFQKEENTLLQANLALHAKRVDLIGAENTKQIEAVEAQKALLADLQYQRDLKPGQAMPALDKQIKEATASLAAMQAAGTTSLPSIDRAGRLLEATFVAARKDGVGLLEAIDDLGPGLDTLIQTYTDLGLTITGTAVADLAAYRDRVNGNREWVASADAVNQTMLAMASIGALNAQSFSDLEQQGQDTYNHLVNAGFTENESLQMMKGFLENVRDAHEKLKLPIDANTQALLDQAEASGTLGKAEESTNQVMTEGLSAIIEALGGKLPEAWQAAADAAKASAAQVADDATAAADAATASATQAAEATATAAQQAALDAAAAVDDATNKMHGSFQQNVINMIGEAGQKLTETDWHKWSIDAYTASFLANAGLHDVSGAAVTVDDKLGDIDWDAFASNAEDAAKKASDAINAVSFGHSPGGIKEIAIQLALATRATHQFATTFGAQMSHAKQQVDALSASSIVDLSSQQSAMPPMVSSVVHTVSRDVSRETTQVEEQRSEYAAMVRDMTTAVERATEANKNSYALSVDIKAFDGPGVQKVIEGQLLPGFLDALKRGRSITVLKDLVK